MRLGSVFFWWAGQLSVRSGQALSGIVGKCQEISGNVSKHRMSPKMPGMNEYRDPAIRAPFGAHSDAHALPVLYSFRRCPYAIRARMALYASGLPFKTIEVSLKNKPARLVELSPKATVPVLVLPGGEVIDESLDIMRWALGQSDPAHWLRQSQELSGRVGQQASVDPFVLLKRNDTDFKHWLDRYKYPVRYPDERIDVAHAREMAMQTLIWPLARVLEGARWLGGDAPCLEDVAIFPFVRQFSGVDPTWFHESVPQSVQSWLQDWLDSKLFERVMRKVQG